MRLTKEQKSAFEQFLKTLAASAPVKEVVKAKRITKIFTLNSKLGVTIKVPVTFTSAEDFEFDDKVLKCIAPEMRKQALRSLETKIAKHLGAESVSTKVVSGVSPVDSTNAPKKKSARTVERETRLQSVPDMKQRLAQLEEQQMFLQLLLLEDNTPRQQLNWQTTFNARERRIARLKAMIEAKHAA